MKNYKLLQKVLVGVCSAVMADFVVRPPIRVSGDSLPET
jgi:hypothetical protein